MKKLEDQELEIEAQLYIYIKELDACLIIFKGMDSDMFMKMVYRLHINDFMNTHPILYKTVMKYVPDKITEKIKKTPP